MNSRAEVRESGMKRNFERAAGVLGQAGIDVNTMKPVRFLWRLFRNLLCLSSTGRRLLFPADALAAAFGRGDADYAWSVFSHHLAQLDVAGFKGATRILEIGPGKNLGTALLWWANLGSRNENNPIEIVCWDVFNNVPCNRWFLADTRDNLAREIA